MATSSAAVPISLGYDPAMEVPLAGQPGYQHPNSGSDFIDERFAPLDTSGSGTGSAALKKFLEEETNRQQGPGRVTLGSDAKGNEVIGTVAHDSREWVCSFSLGKKAYEARAADRDSCLVKASQFVRTSAKPKRPFRELDEAEKLQVARYAQCGEWQTALGQYLWLATDKKEIESPFEITDDPKYRELTDSAVLFVWRHSRPGYSPTPERERYLLEYAAGRPLSMTLLDSAWQACQAAEKDYSRSALLSQIGQPAEPKAPDPRVIQDGLEDLDDNAVNRLMSDTKRHFAREVRAGRL